MNENQEVLKEMGLSCPEIDKICAIAMENGAYGVKLTGTGRGGSVVILTPGGDLQERVAKAIRQAGFETMKTRIGV